MSEENDRKTTQVEDGWRSEDSKTDPNSSKVEDVWRREPSDDSNKATQVDVWWRDPDKSERKATEVDPGWRNQENSERNATEVDPGWRKEISDTLTSETMTKRVTPNFFKNIGEFKEEVEKLKELKSSKGKIYRVEGTISKEGGESIVLLCSNSDGIKVVAKVYYEPINVEGSYISSRKRVLEYMGTEEGKKYTLAVTEIGNVEFGESKYFFEIIPYCKRMDLSDDGAYSFEQIVEITRQLNEALHSIHNADIIHRDIKPENLYKVDGQYKLSDFGIARVGTQGDTNVTKKIEGTEGYRAPESTRYVYRKESDYYSLGVTLASLFEGHFVFKNLNFDMRTKAQEIERLPLTREDQSREHLENLLNGLVKIDYRQRFGYDDVNSWLEDHNYTGGGHEKGWPRKFILPYKDEKERDCTEEYHDEKSMFFGITKDENHWNAARTMLYDNTIANFFSAFRTDLSTYAHNIADEQEYRVQRPDKGLAIFLKKLFSPGPIVWRGKTFDSLSGLAREIVTTNNLEVYGELLKNRCISHWLNNTEETEGNVKEETVKKVNLIEERSKFEWKIACYWFGNLFAKNKQLKICEAQVETIDMLIQCLFSSPKKFYQADGFNKLSSRDVGADLYGFLYSFGFERIIDEAWHHVLSVPNTNIIDKTCILMSMLECIAVRADVDPAIVREFFIFYGPMGIATYIQKLVKEGVYEGLDDKGKTALKKIEEFDIPKNKNIDELIKEYGPLFKIIETFKCMLIDNPHLILAGAYKRKGIICKNLKGCFAFNIFDQVAPLGFEGWINKREM